MRQQGRMWALRLRAGARRRQHPEALSQPGMGRPSANPPARPGAHTCPAQAGGPAPCGGPGSQVTSTGKGNSGCARFQLKQCRPLHKVEAPGAKEGFPGVGVPGPQGLRLPGDGRTPTPGLVAWAPRELFQRPPASGWRRALRGVTRNTDVRGGVEKPGDGCTLGP